MLIRKINREEYLECVKISSVAFEFPVKNLPESSNELVERIEKNPSTLAEAHWEERYAAFEDGGKMMASMAMMPFEAYFDGNIVPMNGIGDVSTLPQYRRGGAIRGVFAAALEDMFKRGDVFSYLYPFSYAFYRKFGYELANDTVMWKVSLNSLPKFGAGGRLEMYEEGYDISGFESVYEQFAAPVNLMLKRDSVLWKRRITGFSPYDSNQWSFIWKNNDDIPKGYLIYQSEPQCKGRTMTIRDFCFSDIEGLHALLEFLSTFASQYEYAKIPLPSNISLAALIPELQYGNVTRTSEFNGMVRTVNVKKALKMAEYKGDGRFVISVTDDTVPANTGIYAVKFGEGTKVEITDEEPDIETDIQNFSRLICGSVSLENCELFPKIKVLKNRDTLSRAFFGKSCWNLDYF